MSIAITGAAGQLGRLVIDDLLSAGIPGTDLIAIARPRPEIGHLDETDRCAHRMRRVYCRSTTRCDWTQMLRSYKYCSFSNSMSNSQMKCPTRVQLDISVRQLE
jgi:nucleoside-diphosphate-sugar epimerase